MTEVQMRARIRGRVQGVFYRASAQRAARELGLTGWVRNCDDGSVELVAKGSKEACERLLEYCGRGPAGARVDDIDSQWATAATGSGFDGFSIRYQ